VLIAVRAIFVEFKALGRVFPLAHAVVAIQALSANQKNLFPSHITSILIVSVGIIMPTYGRCQEVGARASAKRSAMQATLSKMIRSFFRMASTFRHKTLEMKHDVPGLTSSEMKLGA
jgi:hypothetical protein